MRFKRWETVLGISLFSQKNVRILGFSVRNQIGISRRDARAEPIRWRNRRGLYLSQAEVQGSEAQESDKRGRESESGGGTAVWKGRKHTE